jgi:ATP-dependent DNA helicase DinG
MATTEALDLHLSAAAAGLIRREILRARGNEVCFLAGLDEAGAVVNPRVVARGHASAVLAAVREPEAARLVIHNHPSGTLDPSPADLELAARFWEQGLGFGIVDNEASELYVVVEPPARREAEPIDLAALEAELAPGGGVARVHAAYEDRPQQRAFARVIAQRYNEGGIAIAEAGTGTGKSVAYLLPAIRWAVQNRERTVVSTNTINLQEQLVEKDLPLLRRALGEPFRYALVKGRNNYVSIRRARLAWATAPTLLEDRTQSELKAIVEWVETTQDGSLSDLPFRPSPEVWDEVASESDVCLRAKCPHFEQCFYQRARRDATTADVLVVNHHLLFSDLAVRRLQDNYKAPAVLPQYSRLILDEAHNLEEAATGHLGATISRRSLFRVLRRLESRGRGVLPSLKKQLEIAAGDLLRQSTLELMSERLGPALEGARDRASEVFSRLEEVGRRGRESVVRLEPEFADDPVWGLGLEEELTGLLMHLDTLLRGMELVRERVTLDERAGASMEQPLMELRGAANRLESAALALRATLRPGADALNMVRWLEVRRDPRGLENNVVLAAAPLDLSQVLRESLMEKVPTIVLTSATLATAEGFGFLRSRLGLADQNPEIPVTEGVFPSPFEYAEQALLAIPEDLPVPSSDTDGRHDEATVRAAIEHARCTDGGIFVLFTSYRALRQVAAGLRARDVDAEWPLFVQGEAPRAQLVQRFVESGRGILLGTSSFWEGVDVPGHPLRGLVIPKLPFKVPSEPVTAARIEAIEARGGNAFAEYMLPHAAIRLKQGFGRLIRSRMDRGVVLVLDRRIVSKGYGRYLLDSLPPARRAVGPWKVVYSAMREFYAAGVAPAA